MATMGLSRTVSAYDFLLRFKKTMGYLVPYPRYTAISVENRNNFPPLEFAPPLKGFSLGLGTGAGDQKLE